MASGHLCRHVQKAYLKVNPKQRKGDLKGGERKRERERKGGGRGERGKDRGEKGREEEKKERERDFLTFEPPDSVMPKGSFTGFLTKQSPTPLFLTSVVDILSQPKYT